MKIYLEPDFNEDDIQKMLDEFMGRVFKVTKNEMMQIGLEFVQDARLKTKSQGGFDDDTGNLRSSIGFILMYDGEIVHEDFELSTRGSEKHQGLETSRAKAMELGQENPKGWVIVTVAGMEYASWVEAKGYDVISGSTLGAEAKLQKALLNVMRAFE